MIDPNFRELSKLPFTSEMASILDALGVKESLIPAEFIPRQFKTGGCSAQRQDDDCYLCYRSWKKPNEETVDSRGVSLLIGASRADYEAGTHEQGAGNAVLKWFGFVSGSSGDRALRRWLALWGWRDPKAAKAAAKAVEPMVI
jgi:hypothetical protein